MFLLHYVVLTFGHTVRVWQMVTWAYRTWKSGAQKLGFGGLQDHWMYMHTNENPNLVSVKFCRQFCMQMPTTYYSVLRHCWLGIRKSIRPVKIEWRGVGLLVSLSLWSKVQIVCVWSIWCHCHPKTPSSRVSFKSRLVLPFWYQAYPGCPGKEAIKLV